MRSGGSRGPPSCWSRRGARGRGAARGTGSAPLLPWRRPATALGDLPALQRRSRVPGASVGEVENDVMEGHGVNHIISGGLLVSVCGCSPSFCLR